MWNRKVIFYRTNYVTLQSFSRVPIEDMNISTYLEPISKVEELIIKLLEEEFNIDTAVVPSLYIGHALLAIGHEEVNSTMIDNIPPYIPFVRV